MAIYRDYFLGLIAFDERSNEGKLSNIVSVYVDSNDISSADLPDRSGEGSPLAAPAPGPVCLLLTYLFTFKSIGSIMFRTPTGTRAS